MEDSRLILKPINE